MIENGQKQEQRRAHFSRATLRTALMDMMKISPIDTLAVTELCRRAEINRSTFYLYYEDIFDLYNSILADFRLELQTAMKPFISFEPSVELLTRVFEVLNANQDICQVMLGPHSNEAQTYQFAFGMRRQNLNLLKAASWRCRKGPRS